MTPYLSRCVYTMDAQENQQIQNTTEAVCPKEIPLEFIGKLNRDLIRATWHRHREPLVIPGVVQQPFHEHAGAEEETS